MKYKIYIKTSPNGLKYLGQTSRNVNEYIGSGKYWLNHINKHKLDNNDIETEILFETDSKKKLAEKCKYYSKKLNVVKSSCWANLKEEIGDGGSIKGCKHKMKTKIKCPKCGKIGIKSSTMYRYHFDNCGNITTSWNKGIPMTKKAKEKLSKTKTGIPVHTEEHKKKLKKNWSENNPMHKKESVEKFIKARTGYIPKQSTCIYCKRTMFIANIVRWHNDNCKEKNNVSC